MMNPDGTVRRRPVRRPAPDADGRRESAETGSAVKPGENAEPATTGEDNASKEQIIAVPNPDAPMIDLLTLSPETEKQEDHAADEIPAENKAEQI
jgi:hypothetical protein